MTWRTPPRPGGRANELGDARRDAGKPQIHGELAAIARFAGGMHARRHRAQLGDRLDQARQRPGSAGAVMKKKALTVRACARGMAAPAATAWDGMGGVSLHEIAKKSGPAPSGNRDDNNSLGDLDVKDGLHGCRLYAYPR